jgi:hypothetical protein
LLYKKTIKNQSKTGSFACPDCEATFAKVQGLNAHKRHCDKALVLDPADLLVTTGGQNGNHRAMGEAGNG